MKRQCLIMGICLVLFSFCIPVTGAFAGTSDEKSCESCHDEMLNRSLRRHFVHMPFQEKKCRQCHSAGESHESGAALSSARKSEPAQRVQWLAESMEPAMTHYFLLPSTMRDKEFLIEAGAVGGEVTRENFVLAAPGEMPLAVNDGTGPEISNVRVLGVYRGLYIEAGIEWQTNEPAKGTVEYGINSMGHRVLSGNRLSRDNKVLLTGLKKDREYSYKVFAEDRFGNISVAGPFNFSTRGARYQEDRDILPVSARERQVRLIKGFSRNSDGQVLVQISADQSVSVSLGVTEMERAKRLASDTSQVSATSSHPKLKEKRETNIQTCYTCHEKTNSNRSHPVNVKPKRGMIIPAEYSTLPDGRLTCMSCHADHASNFEFRLIKSNKRELCIGCHKGME